MLYPARGQACRISHEALLEPLCCILIAQTLSGPEMVSRLQIQLRLLALAASESLQAHRSKTRRKNSLGVGGGNTMGEQTSRTTSKWLQESNFIPHTYRYNVSFIFKRKNDFTVILRPILQPAYSHLTCQLTHFSHY